MSVNLNLNCVLHAGAWASQAWSAYISSVRGSAADEAGLFADAWLLAATISRARRRLQGVGLLHRGLCISR